MTRREDTLPGVGEETPRGFREPSLMAVALDVTRVREQVKYLVERMEDREDRQDERDAAFRESMKLAVREAVQGAVVPLDARLQELEKAQLEQKAVIKTSVKWAGFAGTVVVFLWGLASKLVGL